MRWFQKFFFMAALKGEKRLQQQKEFPLFCQQLNAIYPQTWAIPLLLFFIISTYFFAATHSGHVWIPDNELTHYGASTTISVLLKRELWRIVTSNFINQNPIYLVGACFILFYIGFVAEQLLGGFAVFTIFITSGAITDLVLLALRPNITLFGSSSSIFGLLGAIFAFGFFSRKKLPQTVSERLMLVPGLFALQMILADCVFSQIHHGFRLSKALVHLTGMSVGIFLGYLLYPRHLFSLNRNITATTSQTDCC